MTSVTITYGTLTALSVTVTETSYQCRSKHNPKSVYQNQVSGFFLNNYDRAFKENTLDFLRQEKQKAKLY